MSDRIVEFDIAVIGAGIAGLISAQSLRGLGHSVVVLEKSRGVGGRVATRRLYDTRADFGAPFLEPRGMLSQQLVQVLSRAGIVVPWTDTVYQVNEGDYQMNPATTLFAPYYVAPAGINAVGKFLARHLPIWHCRRVQTVTPTDQGKWHLELEAIAESKDAAVPLAVQAKAIVMATPAPQAVMLVESGESGLPGEFVDRLKAVEFDPCISVMAGYPASKQRELVQAEYRGRSVVFPPNSPLRGMFWQSSKSSDATQPVFVLHSSAQFAKQYLDTTELEPVGRELCNCVGEAVFPWLKDPEWMQVHRWRYAFCQRPLTEPLLTSMTPLPMVCAGDWCGDRQIETALQSGLAAAEWVNQRLGGGPMPPLASLWEAIATVK
ncbi:NAD(P)/FAD-dependent oxidoreductase [Laspinema olomoucense]|uniref:NAD(P)/FAD-dependent oxidoreductase n=1 Tax=Laspinema olomoucense TaxID=3231600 RepID=UPI0021BB264E|nr:MULTISPECIES: FAD-dependent oxidoreductase [unclassified Laspinema]MCT7975610.1 FAD-dependent oxidoreductase [Laspinema sp. D3d]MCT7991259.1 FAD-dependent oxidoreductase [Laspinema sp. D3a]MCT7996395.1 FAD-dependent oxidoreductase [Laspinema sp. D3c]